jgi:hypothetical protein
MDDVLPDSRTRERKGAIHTPRGWFVPVHCANCGKVAGMVPESHITHVFALCDHGCAGKYGDGAHHFVDPDAIYREKATAEALAKYGRALTQAEAQRELDNVSSPIAKIAKDWQNRVRKEAR